MCVGGCGCLIRMSLLLTIYDPAHFRKLSTIKHESIDLELCVKVTNSFNELCFSLLEIFKIFHAYLPAFL